MHSHDLIAVRNDGRHDDEEGRREARQRREPAHGACCLSSPLPLLLVVVPFLSYLFLLFAPPFFGFPIQID